MDDSHHQPFIVIFCLQKFMLLRENQEVFFENPLDLAYSHLSLHQKSQQIEQIASWMILMKKQRQQAFAQRTPDNEKQSNSAVQLAHPELELRRLDELGEPVVDLTRSRKIRHFCTRTLGSKNHPHLLNENGSLTWQAFVLSTSHPLSSLRKRSNTNHETSQIHRWGARPSSGRHHHYHPCAGIAFSLFEHSSLSLAKLALIEARNLLHNALASLQNGCSTNFCKTKKSMDQKSCIGSQRFSNSLCTNGLQNSLFSGCLRSALVSGSNHLWWIAIARLTYNLRRMLMSTQ